MRELVDGPYPAGSSSVVWDGLDTSGERVRAGLYVVRLEGPGFRNAVKVVLVE